MSFVVYVNHPTSKARIHESMCRHYQNREKEDTRNGFWSKKFKTFEEAKAYARASGKKVKDSCYHCFGKKVIC